MNLKVGDKVVLADEDRQWTETIIEEPQRMHGQVLITTDQRIEYTDPGMKLQVSE
jgi:hypothetical protein